MSTKIFIPLRGLTEQYVLSIEAERDRLRAVNGQLMREGQKLVDWLDMLTTNAEREAKDNRFITLQEAHAADAKNFRATAKGMRAAIAEAQKATGTQS